MSNIKANKEFWNRVQAGYWTNLGTLGGHVITRVVDYNPVSGRGKTVWVAFDADGYKIGQAKSRQAAQRLVVEQAISKV